MLHDVHKTTACVYKVGLVAVSLLLTNITILGQGKTLSTLDAKHHIGDQATVCGRVASERYAPRTRGSPTFLDLNEPYPNQRFTVIIWGQSRAKFNKPEETYRNKSICVTGRIGIYRGEPEIIASDPAQIWVNNLAPIDNRNYPTHSSVEAPTER